MLWLIGQVLLVVAALAMLTSSWGPPGKALPVMLMTRQRIGMVATSDEWRVKYETVQLGAGWIVDFDHPICASHPGGADRAIGLSLRNFPQVDPATLGPLVDVHPGSLWLVGNEPDCIWQDNVLPEQYAYLYHEFYTFIKGRDPSSLVAAGGIVQATPLRLQWLDRVLQAYEQTYGTKMPVDVWQIHNAIVNEQKDKWGADIPPGIDAQEGRVLSPEDHDNLDIFRQQILDFRQWMSDHEYRDKPLIITEYGVLLPEAGGFDAGRVNAFMSATFAHLQTASHETLGYAEDNNLLVQRWAWFSLDFPPYDPSTGRGFNGNLFDPKTGEITAAGLHFTQLLKEHPALPHVDLAVAEVTLSPLVGPDLGGETVTRTITVEMSNLGSQNSGAFYVLLESDGPVRQSFERPMAELGAGERAQIVFVLSDLPVGAHHIRIRVDSRGDVSESDECNNEANRLMLIPSHHVYLPAVRH